MSEAINIAIAINITFNSSYMDAISRDVLLEGIFLIAFRKSSLYIECNEKV